MAGAARLSLIHLSHGYRFVLCLCDIKTGVALLTGKVEVLYMKIVAESYLLGLLGREDNIAAANPSQGNPRK